MQQGPHGQHEGPPGVAGVRIIKHLCRYLAHGLMMLVVRICVCCTLFAASPIARKLVLGFSFAVMAAAAIATRISAAETYLQALVGTEHLPAAKKQQQGALAAAIKGMALQEKDVESVRSTIQSSKLPSDMQATLLPLVEASPQPAASVCYATLR